MTEKLTKRDKLFESVFQKFYGKTPCFKYNCIKCESFSLIFLPGEAQFIAKKLNIKVRDFAKRVKTKHGEVWAIPSSVSYDCLFLKDKKYCTIHDIRPLACRSFPVLPVYKNGKVNFILDDICPIVKDRKISKKFINGAIKAWKTINPSKRWWKIWEDF